MFVAGKRGKERLAQPSVWTRGKHNHDFALHLLYEDWQTVCTDILNDELDDTALSGTLSLTAETIF